MNIPDLRLALLAAASGLLFSPLGAADSGPPNGINLGPEGAAPVSLSLEGRTISFSGGGGFRVFDAAAKRPVELSAGKVTEGTAFDAAGGGIRLHAEFMPRRDYILVRGEVENMGAGDRGLIVDYRLPRLSAGAVFSNSLEQSLPMGGAAAFEGNAFPIGAMAGGGAGVAMAIPPSEPSDFGLVADETGMTIRFYLGLSPLPRRFPNRASFVFFIYGIEPKWGFRSALDRYYHFFPDYYTPLLKREGLFMFQMDDRVPANVDQYGYDAIESQLDDRALGAAIARDREHGITSFPYILVGQREIKFLPQLPKSYEEVMATYHQWSLADQAGHPLTKENVTSQGDIHLKEEIDSSACQNSEGRSVIVLRDTRWGGKSITFKMNPNPDLFADRHRPTLASYQLELVDRWIKEHPEYGGIYVDSLGANWPALFNYRQDHFVYARYPLTIDPQGRVALQNTVSHYEFLETLRAKMRQSGRLITGNGVYTYKSRGSGPNRRAVEKQQFDAAANEFVKGAGPPEHYRGAGTKLGRFFISALLDAASCEVGSRASVDQCQDNRVLLGRKPYVFINYEWEDAAVVEEFVNKCLCYGIYASSTTTQSGVPYENRPNGYLRDRPLLDWFVPLVRTLTAAGWEPVRDAAVAGVSVTGERFGHGDTVYFTLYNDSESKQTASLKVDLASLGFADDNATLTEIARNAPLKSLQPGGVSIELAPQRACVIRLTRTVR